LPKLGLETDTALHPQHFTLITMPIAQQPAFTGANNEVERFAGEIRKLTANDAGRRILPAPEWPSAMPRQT